MEIIYYDDANLFTADITLKLILNKLSVSKEKK